MEFDFSTVKQSTSNVGRRLIRWTQIRLQGPLRTKFLPKALPLKNAGAHRVYFRRNPCHEATTDSIVDYRGKVVSLWRSCCKSSPRVSLGEITISCYAHYTHVNNSIYRIIIVFPPNVEIQFNEGLIANHHLSVRGLA